MPNANPLSPRSISDLLPSMRAVAADAEERARVLREYVGLIEAAYAGGEDLDAQIADPNYGPGWAKDLQERIDAACHIHSGSSEASRLRMLNHGILNLLAFQQREGALR